MEVHHHPHVEKKRLKEYFLEFVMIFLAVTLGFIAENIREHISEQHRARTLATLLIEDLKTDTARIKTYNTYYKAVANNIDTFMNLVANNNLDSIPSGKLYWYGLFGGGTAFFVPVDATFQQMKSSGTLSFLRPKLATDIEKYDMLCRSLQVADDFSHNIYAEVRKTRAQIFSFKYNNLANQIVQRDKLVVPKASIDSFIATNPPLLNRDKSLMNQYVELVRSRFIRTYNVTISDSIAKQANLVLAELQKEYD